MITLLVVLVAVIVVQYQFNRVTAWRLNRLETDMFERREIK